VSLVAFRFCKTKLLGYVPVPFHSNFDEVNLRFYVRREVGGERRRGVVFIAEVMSRFAIAWIARAIYGENYKRVPLRHHIESSDGAGRLNFSGRSKANGAGFPLIAMGSALVPKRAAWSNSLASIPGAIRSSETEAAWNIASRMPPGKFGEPQPRPLKATPIRFTERNSEPCCGGSRSTLSWQRVRQSRFSRGERSSEPYT
jgi:Uncharacterized conserved protein (COG2071)